MAWKPYQFAATALAVMGLWSSGAMAADATYQIEAKAGAFSPANLQIPAGQKVAIVVKNSDSAQVEFESYPLNIEQKIDAGDSSTFYVGPLDAGSYAYFDDNNPDAKGTVTVK